jgi:2TM domain-containing protein
MITNQANEEDVLRQRAVLQVKKRRDFYGHLLVFVLVNAAVIAIWAMVGDGGFFWPGFLMFSWGIGVVMHAWDVFYMSYEDEGQIQREIDRLHRHGMA